MVIAPAKTGRASKRRVAVIRTDHTNRGVQSHVILGERMLIIVEIKLIAPRIDEAPAKWRLKIDKSMEAPEWARLVASGG